MVVTGSGPSKPEISVRSFDPALTVTRSSLAVEVADEAGAPGRCRRRRIGGFVVVEEPLSDARQQRDVVRLAIGDQEVGEGCRR